jgi:hypothetical protein
MQSRKWLNSDRSLESLEARLRALPQPLVPGDLESKLLAAMPLETSIETQRSALARRPRHFVLWAAASLATAAAILLVVRFWPKPDDQHPAATVVLHPKVINVAPQITDREPDISRRILPWFEAQLDPDETELPTFSWPIQEKSPLIVSTALRPDLFD